MQSQSFKLSDITAMIKVPKANKKILEFLPTFDLKKTSMDYKIQVYFILGENDWQTPYVIAQEYFNKIKAPD